MFDFRECGAPSILILPALHGATMPMTQLSFHHSSCSARISMLLCEVWAACQLMPHIVSDLRAMTYLACVCIIFCARCILFGASFMCIISALAPCWNVQVAKSAGLGGSSSCGMSSTTQFLVLWGWSKLNCPCVQLIISIRIHHPASRCH